MFKLSAMLNFIQQYWLGRLSLGLTWWGVCLAGPILISLSAGYSLFGTWPNGIETTGAFGAYLARSIICLVAIPVWQVVGLWRATDFLMEQVGTILAGRATQGGATLCLIFIALRVATFCGQALPLAPAALKIGRFPPAET